jgi:hypothetical protein
MKKSLSIIIGAALLLLFSVASFAQDCGYGKVLQNGVCRNTRTVSTAPSPFVAAPVKNADGIMLYPTATPAVCATSSQQDSNCTVVYTYTDPNPPPTITASFSNPSPVATVSGTSPIWNSTNAVTVTSNCYGVAGASSGPVSLQGNPSGLTFNSSLPGIQTCTFIATNSIGLTATATATATFSMPLAAPTIVLTRTPTPLHAGQSYTTTWTTTNATSLVIDRCTSTGTGWTQGSQSMGINGTFTGTASAAWVGFPSTCTWIATGAGGTFTLTDVFTTVAGTLPVISLNRTPNPMVAGQNETITYSATNATSFSVACTSTGTGYAQAASAVPLSGSGTGLASAAWVGYPSTCTWTATGPGGTTSQIEILTTVAAPAQLAPVHRFRDSTSHYFYTSDPAERDSLFAASWYWIYEGVGFHVYNTSNAISGLLPVYRFWNDAGGWFYTVLEAEKASLLAFYPDYHYAGIAWYAKASPTSGMTPLYRFYNSDNNTHFYTASAAERDYVITYIPSWWQDGSSQYVWP